MLIDLIMAWAKVFWQKFVDKLGIGEAHLEIVKVELIIIISRRESKVHFALHARFLIGNCKLIVLKVANERRLASSFEFFIKLFIIFMKYQSFANKIDYQYNQLTLKFTNFFFFFPSFPLR